jgi:hypothetical protein
MVVVWHQRESQVRKAVIVRRYPAFARSTHNRWAQVTPMDAEKARLPGLKILKRVDLLPRIYLHISV